ncbi:MAG TPA: protein kinase [Solirubrobacteraceae bacterium]|nr:protein kinase [Solirubrobacteraceae bacterium]
MATLINERYEILELLGVGGEGRVVKALDRRHDRLVTLKIRPVRDDQAREELLSEARILLAVPSHPALPLVREDFFDGDDYVVAMDWVDGTDLATLLRERGRPGLAPSSVLAYLSQTADALTHLHAQVPPVIHGDVKPANLILTTGGRVKLVDFGISSAPNALRRHLGTPGYRAPELATDGAPSRASDVYALAATAFALLTGSAPAGVLPAWEGIDPAQAEQFEAAIRLGMATDPARRPATPGELVERLRAGWAEALPTGVITFCLSDIEGSPALWDAHPAAMAEALVRHDELIADCVERRGGRFLKSIGESTVSVFDSAPDALAATVAATRALSGEQWPEDLPIAVCFGIHTGEADRRGTEYLGPAVNLAVQLRDQADGGQIFLSLATAELVAGHLPEGCELVDLGPHRLRGLGKPEQVRAVKAPGITAPLAATECPYRGLLAFEPEDRAYFFGREAVIRELIERLERGGLVAVVGASGSGKSSVLRAGLIATVRAGEVAVMERAVLLTPADSPRVDVEDDPAQLVVVDQFEELFTLWEDPDRRQAFIDALLAVRGPVAIGVRADMYGKLMSYPELARAVAANQVPLGAMSEDELERAVTEPARLAGLRLEPGLVELAVRDVAGEPGALPLLSHALRATWERRDGRTLTVEAYRATGGVASAIARTADSVLASLPPQQRQIARSVFLRLTELRDGAAETRRRATIEELVPEGVSPEAVETLLERLAEARLVTLGEDTAEVAHEVLIREWPTLRGWLEEDREGLRLHRQLGAAARIWDSGGRERSDLYRGARLTAAADWAQHHEAELNATERRFLDTSLQEADRERRAQLRANRRLRALLAGALALLLIAVVAGVIALIQRSQAQAQRSHAQAQALTSDAERLGAEALSDPNVDHSLLLAVTGVELQNRLQTRSDLFADLQQNAALLRLIRPSNVEITALDVSPDGRLLVVGDASGTVRFINLATWRTQGALVRLDEPIGQRDLSFSPDGHTVMAVAIGPHGSELYAIDVASRRARRILSWNGSPPQDVIDFEAVAYSPDSAQVAVTEEDWPDDSLIPTASRLVMLDASTGRVRWRQRYPLRPGQADPYVVFTAAGMLLTSAQQGDTLIWDPRTGQVVRRFPLGGVPALAPDGRTVALGQNSPFAGDQSASVVLLDLRTGSHRALLANLPENWIRSLAFTPNGSEIAGASTGGVHVWDVASGKIILSPVAQAGAHSLSALDPDTEILISGQQDGSLTAFDLSGARRLGRTFSWNTPEQSCGNNPCMAVNRQSSLMATDQADGTVAVVDLRTLRLVRTLPTRDGSGAAAISFMPDGRTLITGGANRQLGFWDVNSGRVTRTLRFAQPVWWTAASPDGRLLAVQTGPADGPDNHVEVVRIATGAVLQSHALPYEPGGVEFTHDGRELVALGCCWTGSGSALVAWDVRSGRQLFKLGDSVNASAFDIAPGSELLGVGTEGGQVLFLDPRTGRRTAPPIQVATGEISNVSFSPDGRSYAVSSLDETASVWDLQSGTRLGNTFGPYPGTDPTPLFEPNGRLLIVLLSNAIEWPMNVNTWMQFACRVAGRNLTRTEWQEVLPNRAYRPTCPAGTR